MRAVKDSLAAPLGAVRDEKMGGLRWSPVLVQRAVSEGGEGQPSRPPARGTRTIGMCSPGLMARLGVPVGGRVRRSRAIEDRPGYP